MYDGRSNRDDFANDIRKNDTRNMIFEVLKPQNILQEPFFRKSPSRAGFKIFFEEECLIFISKCYINDQFHGAS